MDKLYKLMKNVFNGNLYTYKNSKSQPIKLDNMNALFPDNMNDFKEYNNLMLLKYAEYKNTIVFPGQFARNITSLFKTKYDHDNDNLIKTNTQTANKYYLILVAIISFTILQNSINSATIFNNNIKRSIDSARKISDTGYYFAEYPDLYHPKAIKNYNIKTRKAIEAIEKSINDYQNN